MQLVNQHPSAAKTRGVGSALKIFEHHKSMCCIDFGLSFLRRAYYSLVFQVLALETTCHTFRYHQDPSWDLNKGHGRLPFDDGAANSRRRENSLQVARDTSSGNRLFLMMILPSLFMPRRRWSRCFSRFCLDILHFVPWCLMGSREWHEQRSQGRQSSSWKAIRTQGGFGFHRKLPGSERSVVPTCHYSDEQWPAAYSVGHHPASNNR